MKGLQWRGIGPVDLGFVVALTVVLWLHRPRERVAIAMVAVAILVLLVSWGETRRTIRKGRRSWLATGFGLVATVAMLATWVYAALLSPDHLPRYFGALAGFFALQAIRDANLRRLTPVELLIEGYAHLVAVFLVLGAAANAIAEFEIVLLMIAGAVFIVRKLFVWIAALINWLVPEDRYEY